MVLMEYWKLFRIQVSMFRVRDEACTET